MTPEEIMAEAGKISPGLSSKWCWAGAVRSGKETLVKALEISAAAHKFQAKKLQRLLEEARKIEEKIP